MTTMNKDREEKATASPDDHLSLEDRVLLEKMADWLVERRMSTPAVLFLESVKPLNFLGSQAMFFFEPMVKAFFTAKDYTRLATLMEHRDSVETLLSMIEASDERTRHRKKEEKGE